MEVINVNQWNNEFDGNEFDGNKVEEISLLRKRKSIVQRTSSSGSDNNIEEKGGGLDFIESETKPKFEVLIAEGNAEMIIPQEKTNENDTNLPVSSDSPLNEDSTSLINVTNESDEVIVVKENGEERQEFYLENVFEKLPSHGFYCPNCNVCIQKVYIQRIYIQPRPQNETIRCSSCFTFLIPIGNLF